MDKIIIFVVALLVGYSFIGTNEDVGEIKQRAPSEISSRNWELLRYEGYKYGSWGNHGGKVWYHVKDLGHKNTYYRVYVTQWDDELHFHYGDPESINRINIDSDT